MSAARFSHQARADLNEIWDYIAVDSSRAADRLLERLQGQARLVATQPRMGRARFELAAEIRSFPVGEYVLFYRPLDPGGIQIVRVLHSRRDITGELF